MSTQEYPDASTEDVSHRDWTKHVSGNFTVVGYDPHKILIRDNDGAWFENDVWLEPNQMKNFHEFVRNSRDTTPEISLGENSDGVEATVQRVDGDYIISHGYPEVRLPPESAEVIKELLMLPRDES